MEPAQRTLTLTLFGGFEACCGGDPLAGLQERDGERLLALLALQHGRPLRTDALAQSLWPASGSLDSLHQAASNLRRALGELAHCLQSPKGSLQLDLAVVRADVVAFDRA